ncbi:MAG: sodium:proton antiporter, partial [Cyanobacteria bacterium P01_A01_bin.83]
AWAIPTFAPKLLTKDPVDPTKTNIVTPTIILGVVTSFSSAIAVLTQVADLTRRTNGRAIILYIYQDYKETNIDKINLLTAKLLADIPYQVITSSDTKTESIIKVAQEHQVTTITLAKNTQSLLSQEILNNTDIPLTLI